MRAITILIAAAMISGCAFTVHDVNVDYKYQQPTPLRASGAKVNVEDFSDSRGTSNPRLIMNMKNLNGHTTTGGWQAEKPLAEIVRDGVIQALTTAGATIQSGSNIDLSGQLQDFTSEIIMGAWDSELRGKLTFKLQLKQAGSGTVLWKDTIIATGAVNGKVGAPALFRETLDNALKGLMSDNTFIQQLRNSEAQLPVATDRVR